MAAESTRPEPPGPSDNGPLIFVSDETDDGVRLGLALRTRGYSVADVHTTEIGERAASAPPSLIVCDADQREAVASVASAARLLGQAPIVIALGESGSLTGGQVLPLTELGAECFTRPVDTYAVLRRVEALLGAPSPLPGGSLMPPSPRSAPPRSSIPPHGSVPPSAPSHPAPSRPRPLLVPSEPPPPPSDGPAPADPTPPLRSPSEMPAPVPLSELESSPPPSANAPSTLPPTVPLSLGLDGDGDSMPRQIPQSQMSAELQSLLASAERRVREVSGASSHPPNRLSPEAEVDAVLPSEILDALDEPLEDDDDPDSSDSRYGTGSVGTREPRTGTEAPDRRGTHATMAHGTTGVGMPSSRSLPVSAEPEGTAAPATGLDADTGAEPLAGMHADQVDRGGTDGATSSLLTSGLGGETSTGSPQHPETDAKPAVADAAQWDPSDLPPITRSVTSPEPEPESTNPPPRGTAPPSSSTSVPAFREAHRLGPPPADPLLGHRGALPPPPPSRQPANLSTLPQPGPSRVEPMRENDSFPRPATFSSLHPQSLGAQRDRHSIVTPPSTPPVAAVSTNPVFASPPPQVSTTTSSFSQPSVAMAVPGQELQDEPFDLAGRQSPRRAPEDAPNIPASLGPGDAVTALATLVRTRYSGAVAFESSNGILRIVLRDGDFVTAASGIESHALTAFLVQQGALAPKLAEGLSRRIPQFGRHAGAALIAHGHLRQDELWPVLRSHAEWLVGRALLIERGAASVEPDVPARLKSEPPVFGGATGAEVFVELVRRVVSPEEAVARLGGRDVHLGEGVAPALLGECALPEHELAHANRARGATLGDALQSTNAPDFAAVLYALCELGVITRQVVATRVPANSVPPPDELDEEARRARIRARFALVEEGDYFAVLGVSRSATSYDIRRAYTELRREFEPTNALTASTADLRDEVDVIVEVLEEAYEILRDGVRRERYRRALDASPR